jgi:G:T/U-mismatch repair DNA glycosylase
MTISHAEPEGGAPAELPSSRRRASHEPKPAHCPPPHVPAREDPEAFVFGMRRHNFNMLLGLLTICAVWWQVQKVFFPAAGVVGATTQSQCPVNAPQYRKHFFPLVDRQSWDAAQSACKEKGGTLATVENLLENEQAAAMCRAASLATQPYCYTGMKKSSVPSHFSNWDENTKSHNNQCVVLQSSTKRNKKGGLVNEYGKWTTVPCTEKHHAVCMVIA